MCTLRILVVVFLAFISTALLGPPVLAQTDINDVHIAPRDTAPLGPTAAAPIGQSGGAFLHVIKSDVNLVLVPVSVTDGMERLVKGLGRNNFQVFEEKQPQEIRSFSSEDVPISVGIILDTSGSMSNKVDRVREAVHQFCETSNLQDEFFLIEFSDEPHLVTGFTSKPEEIEKELLFTRPKGRTSLLDAIYLGLRTMKQAKYQKRALLIISDGGDNHSRYDEKEVKAAAKESDVMIYSIGTFDRYVPTAEEVHGPELLSQITEPTGGRAFTLSSVAEMPAVAHRIGTELRTQYVLAYRPQGTPHDGKWHKILVKLRLPRRFAYFQARFRTGYYAMQR
jgi:Ca-activated chloride channel family protein